MLVLRRAASSALSTRILSQTVSLQPRCITTLSTFNLRSSRPATITQFLNQFNTHAAQWKDSYSSEESIEERAIAEAETSDSQPLQPETTSAAEFDASDIEPVQTRTVSHGESQESSTSQPQFQKLETGPSQMVESFPPTKELFIGNLFFDVTEEDLRREFSRFGTLLDLRIVKDQAGMSKGFGYVTFLDQTDATSALTELNKQVFEGRRLTVAYRKPQSAGQIARERSSLRRRETAPPSKTLYIGNMSFDLTDQDLSKLFTGIKNVVDVRVAIDRRTGQPRGFAHADFLDIESAELAFEKLNGKEVYGRSLRCDYSAPSSRVRGRADL